MIEGFADGSKDGSKDGFLLGIEEGWGDFDGRNEGDTEG